MSARRLLVCGALLGCHHARPSVAAPALIAEGRLVPFAGSDSESRSSALAFGRFGIPVTIHGRTLLMMADHGANASTLTDAAIERLRLPHWYDGSTRVDTLIGGRGHDVRPDSTAEVTLTRGDTVFRYWDIQEPAPLDSLRLGASRQDSVLLPLELPAASVAPFDGVIGRDILSQFDLLFDLPAGTLRLYARSHATATDRPPGWLPPGMRASDCVPTRVLRHTMDTTGLDEEGRRALLVDPAKRIWEQEEMRLPLVVDGRPIDGAFDSGAGATTMNWAEARALGITPTSPRVRPYGAGGSRIITVNARRTIGAADSTFALSGLALRVGGARFRPDTVIVADVDFADSPDYATAPMFTLGMRLLRDERLFLSYSTGFACLTRRAQ
jgi:hypothetical protein